jgi:membrane-associated protease RseP (regulator of RpoE activity)
MVNHRKAIVASGFLLAAVAMAGLIRAMLFTQSRLPGPVGHPASVTRQVEPNHWIVSERDRDRYLGDPAAILRQIILKPNSGKEPDSVTDLSILKVAEESPMYEAGFRKDDRIVKVNGTPIRTMGRAVNLIHEIKACTRLTVQVQRGDQIIDFKFEFE